MPSTEGVRIGFLAPHFSSDDPSIHFIYIYTQRGSSSLNTRTTAIEQLYYQSITYLDL